VLAVSRVGLNTVIHPARLLEDVLVNLRFSSTSQSGICNLVNYQNHIPSGTDFIHNLLQALFTAHLVASHQQTNIQGYYALFFQNVRYIFISN